LNEIERMRSILGNRNRRDGVPKGEGIGGVGDAAAHGQQGRFGRPLIEGAGDFGLDDLKLSESGLKIISGDFPS
jgi:hypothetical protein